MMGKRSHNKRRNTYLMYEFIVRRIVDATISDDLTCRDVAMSIIDEHFSHGHELNKELKAFDAVMQLAGCDASIVVNGLKSVKADIIRHDHVKLSAEKLVLIERVVRDLGDEIFEARIQRYRLLAAVYDLFNAWRDDPVSSASTIQESVVAELLSSATRDSDRHKHIDDVCVKDSDRIDDVVGSSLVTRLMLEKLNKRYANNMTPTQLSIMRAIAGALDGVDEHVVIARVLNETHDALASVTGDEQWCVDGIKVKIDAAKRVIASMRANEGCVIDADVTHCMVIAGLLDELDGQCGG